MTGLLQASARFHGRRPAILHDGQTLTYAELLQRSQRLAGGLAGLGLGRGDHLVNWLPNGREWLVLQFAAAWLGLACPLLNTRYRAAELEHVLRTSRPRCIVLGQGFHGIDFRGLLDETGLAPEHVLEAGDLRTLERAGPNEAVGARADVAVLFTTSGTTASPKLAGHDQRGVALHARFDARAFDLRPGDVMLMALPLCGAFGFAGAACALHAGATLVLQAIFDPQEAVGLMERHRVTHFYGSDAMVRPVLETAGGDRRPFERWRWGCFANFGGRPLELVTQAEEAAGVRLHGTYGSSECFALMARWPADAPAEQRALAGGFLVSGQMHVRVCDPQSGRALSAGEQGELQFRGYNVTTGYHANRAATAAAFTEDGWYRSGDLGYLRDDGAFVFLSRLTDSLRVRGYLVDPLEIEEQMERHAAVEAAQVVGVPVEGEGDVPVAFVKLERGVRVSADELADFCRQRLASYKVPRLVKLVDQFPTVDGPNGRKVQKVRLREEAALELERWEP